MHIMTTEQAEQIVAAFYVGYFNRAPDPEGLEYWTNQLLHHGSTFDLAAAFTSSDEAADTYPQIGEDGTVTDPIDFLREVYQNLFGRELDPSGEAFWSGHLEDGVSPIELIRQMIINVTGPDAETLNDKVEAGLHYTKLVDIFGDYNTDEAREVVSLVDGSEESLQEAKEKAQEHGLPPEDDGDGDGGGGGGGGDPVVVYPEHDLEFIEGGEVNILSTKNYAGTQAWYGGGNYIDEKNIMIDHTAGVEMAMGVSYRHGDVIVGDDIGEGIMLFEGLAGSQIVGKGESDRTDPDRSAVSFDVMINLGVGDLDNTPYEFVLRIDVDPTEGEEFQVYTLQEIAPGVGDDPDRAVWVGPNGAAHVPFDPMPEHISQHSVNFGFDYISSQIDGADADDTGDIPAGEYTIELEMWEDGRLIGELKNLIVLNEPEVMGV